MPRKLPTFLLLILMLVHSFVMAGQPVSALSGDFEHTMLHWSDVGHHHHDADYHLDDSPEAQAHVQLDGCVSCAYLLSPDFAFVLPSAGAAKPSLFVDASRPPPVLEGLRRPPRLTAG